MMKNFKENTNKYIVLAICLVLILSMATACGQQEAPMDKEIVAKVNDTEISKEELYDYLVSSYGAQSLNVLISEKIVELEAEKIDVEISEEDIEKELARIIELNGGQIAFDQAMVQQGLDMDEVRANVIMNLKIKNILEPDIDINQEEIKDFFQANKDYFNEVEEVHASHILVETEEIAQEVKAKIAEDEDFAKLANQYSKDPGTKQHGGDLGFFPRGKMVPSFEESAFSLQVGEISEPIKSDYGYHIIKVHEKKEAKEATLDNFQEEVKEMLIEDKLPQVYQEWYQEKYKEYDIMNSLAPKS